MTADICIPAYNEEEIIEEAAREVKAAFAEIPKLALSLIVANNGSTDATAERAARVEDVQVLSVEEKGKGAAIVAAAKNSQADLFGFIDADLSADPRDFKKLYGALTQGADIAIGSRLLDEGLVKRGFLRSLSSRIFNTLRRILLGISVVDSQCGLKLMNSRGRAILGRCEEKGWFMDMEFLSKAEKAGLTIVEIPVHWDESRFANRSSKLSVLRDGVQAVRAMVRIRNRMK